jgi:hypothetical protein
MPKLWYIMFLDNFNSGVSPRLLHYFGRYEMKIGKLNLITAIISSGLILQCWFAGQAIAASEPNAAVPQTAAEPNGPPPKIVFEKTTHDFGSVAPGSLNPCKFKFKNEGQGVLKISEVTKTCGCTVFSLDKKDFAPGEEGSVDVSYNADKATGQRTRHLYVLSNDPVSPRIELTIKASIAQKIIFEPNKLDFALRGERAGVLDLTLKCVDDQPFSITGYNSTGNAVSLDFDPNQKAVKFVLKTKLDTQKTGINNSGQIELTTSHPECPSIIVPFSALPRFKVEPLAINILSAEPGKIVKRELWVLNNYNEDFDIASATSKDNIIKVTAQEKVGTRYKLSLDVLPPQAQGQTRMFTDTLTITTKDGEKIEVVCRGFFQRN